MSQLLRVLFVEDSEVDTELIRAQLARGGYDVEHQRVDTEDAMIAALRNRTWDLVISDFSMPTFDGMRAFELFRAQGYDIPFIFVSGAMGEERAVRAMKAGARDYILKGQLGRLNAAVQRELAEAESRRKWRAAEQAREREQRRLAVALQATGAGVFEYPVPEGREGFFNDRFAEMLGVSRDELPRADGFFDWFLERLHDDERERLIANRAAFREGRAPEVALELRMRHKDGSWLSVALFVAAASRDEHNNVTGVIGVMIDRTQERRMEEQFRQAQKMEAIGRLAGGIAHDFNNLLTVISNFGEFVLERLPPKSAVREDMEEVLKAARRAENLTSQLLAYSRSRPVSPQLMNVNDLVGDVDKMLRRLVGEGIELRTDLAPDLWSVRIDSGGLEQVILNLAVNARDAMPNGGRISIETANAKVGDEYLKSRGVDVPPGHYVSISVTDNGMGMDADTQSRLFEPFFTTKAAGQGTGLGLATCYGIVKQAGGYIWVYSEPGHGSTFKVLLPRVTSEGEPAAEPTHSEKMRGDETVLVVEDEEPVRRLVIRMLDMLGYTVLEATNAAEALETARSARQPIDAVLTDVVMPETNGPELVAKLLAFQPQMKAVYMSGYTRGAIQMDDTIVLVQKPFAPKDLARKLRDALDRPD